MLHLNSPDQWFQSPKLQHHLSNLLSIFPLQLMNKLNQISPPTDTAPNTPASISTSAALEIEEYLDLLDAEDEEGERYKADPDRLKRDIEINERVNRAIAEAEEAALAREILSPRTAPATERKTVQFAKENQTHIVENDYGVGDNNGEIDEAEVMTRTVYVWNNFRDFVTARSVTGFEEFVPEPRILRAKAINKSVRADETPGETVQEKSVEDENPEGVVEAAPVDVAKVESKTSMKEIPAATLVPAPAPANTTPTTHVPIPSKADLPPLAQSTIHQNQGWDSILTPAVPSETTKPAPVTVPVSISATPVSWVPISGPPFALVAPPPAPVQPSPEASKSTPPAIPSKLTSAQTKYTPPLKPNYFQSQNNNISVSVLRDVEPPTKVASTWDLPTTPAVRIGTENRYKVRQRKVNDDPFFEGLSESKKVEAKEEGKNVVVVEEPKSIETTETDPVDTPATTDPTPPSNIKSPIIAPRPILGSQTFAAMAGPIPSLTKPVITSPPPVSSAQRTGMPVPVPIPPRPKPAIKSPVKAAPIKPVLPMSPGVVTKPAVIKPAIAPKPANLASTPKARVTLSPIIGGLVDPFLAGLEPEAKKEKSSYRPKTPSVGFGSTDSTPEKPDWSTKNISINTPLDNPLTASSSPSPTSLSSSWTLIDKIKKNTDVSAPPSTPAIAPGYRTWFGPDTKPLVPTPAPIPAVTSVPPAVILATTPLVRPSIPAVKPPSEPTTSTAKPYDPGTGRKLFTFELKVGQSILSIPVHELDNPRVVAEQFAKEHNLETRLQGGNVTVEKIIGYFETQFAERKNERGKRRAERRERMKSALTGEQQKL